MVTKNKTARARTYNIPTFQQLITATFENQLQNFQNIGMQLKKGDQILARMRGYDPWPAKILDFLNNKKLIKCYFYGTHNTGTVGIKNAIPFGEAFETIRLICLRNPFGFIKGIKEIEIESRVPEENSCLKEFEAID